MEAEVKKRLKPYYKWKGIALLIYIVGTVNYLYFILAGEDQLYWTSGHIYVMLQFGMLVLFLLSLTLFQILYTVGNMKLASILSVEGDPFLFESCLCGRAFGIKKRDFLLNQAIARFYQGNFEGAWESIQKIRPEKLKRTLLLNYYIIRSALCFRLGMDEQAAVLEEEYRRRLKPKQAANYQILCTGNNVHRAMKNQDYEAAFRFLQERMELNKNRTALYAWVSQAYLEAKIARGLGEIETARMKLQYVIDKGNRLYYVQEAKQMLAQMDVAPQAPDHAGQSQEG